MELKDVLYQMMNDHQNATQPADLRVGTVTAVNPLEITINTSMAPLKAGILLLTEPVVEKKIPVLVHKHYIQTLSHNHICPDGTTTTDLTDRYLGEDSLVSEGYDPVLQNENIICYEHGKPLPIKDGYIILNRALEVGDKVILMRVQNGQKFIILSRVFEQEAG